MWHQIPEMKVLAHEVHFLGFGGYLLNNLGEDGGFVSMRGTLTNPPPPFFEKILWWGQNIMMQLSCQIRRVGGIL